MPRTLMKASLARNVPVDRLTFPVTVTVRPEFKEIVEVEVPITERLAIVVETLIVQGLFDVPLKTTSSPTPGAPTGLQLFFRSKFALEPLPVQVLVAASA